jgi:hypothetical protein
VRNAGDRVGVARIGLVAIGQVGRAPFVAKFESRFCLFMARPQFLFESLDVVDFGLVHDALGMANSANFGVGRSTHGLVLGPGVEGRHGIDRPEHSWHVRTSSSHDVSIGRLGTLASIHGGGIVKGSLSW